MHSFLINFLNSPHQNLKAHRLVFCTEHSQARMRVDILMIFELKQTLSLLWLIGTWPSLYPEGGTMNKETWLAAFTNLFKHYRTTLLGKKKKKKNATWYVCQFPQLYCYFHFGSFLRSNLLPVVTTPINFFSEFLYWYSFLKETNNKIYWILCSATVLSTLNVL